MFIPCNVMGRKRTHKEITQKAKEKRRLPSELLVKTLTILP